jgi:hypothetical protein
MGCKSHEGVLIKDRSHMKMEAEMGATWLQALECLGPPGAGEAGRLLSWSLQTEHGPVETLVSRTVRE